MLECCLMKDGEASCDAKADAVRELLVKLAKSLGYEYVTLYEHLVSCGRDGRRCACVFRCSGCADCLKAKAADGHLEVAYLDMPSSSDGKAPAPLHCAFAKELYRLLDNGKALYVAGQKLDASMVPEFMVMGALVLSHVGGWE